MILSILICSISERLTKFPALAEHLVKQAEGKPVEILWLGDNITMGLGEKQNKLLCLAKGDYVAFVDDDDWVSNDFIDEVLKAAEQKPDVISVDMLYSHNGDAYVPVHVSIQHNEFVNNPPHFYKRYPTDKSFVRREYALKTGFDEKLKIGIDTDFATRIRPLLKTEVRTAPMYYYHYNTKTTTTKNE